MINKNKISELLRTIIKLIENSISNCFFFNPKKGRKDAIEFGSDILKLKMFMVKKFNRIKNRDYKILN